MDTVLSIKHLKKQYGSFTAVNDLSFDIKADEVFALIGPNGAGKSTTLKMVASILTPTAGEIIIEDFDVAKEPEKARKVISYLPEEAGAYKRLTGMEYLKLMAGLYSDTSAQYQEFVALGQKIADLGGALKHKVGTYSKGMTRKLLLARAIMTRPKLAILDEPTSGLDIINAMHIRNTIKKFAKEGMSVLLSSHNMLEIEHLSDRVAIISQGKIYATDTPEGLKKKYQAKNIEEVFIKLTQK